MATPNKNFKSVLEYPGITNLKMARARIPHHNR